MKRYLQGGILGLLALCSSSLHADGWFTFDPVTLRVEVDMFGYIREVSTADDVIRSALDTTLHIEQEGAIFDERILTFDYRLSPTYRYEFQEFERETDSSGSNFVNYAANLTILDRTALPVRGNLGVVKNKNINQVSLASRQVSDSLVRLAAVSWDNVWLPVSLSYRNSELEQRYLEQRTNELRVRRDEARQVFDVRARNRKLGFRVSYQSIDDRSGRNLDFDTTTAGANHQFRWGRGSSLRTAFNYYERSGSQSSTWWQLRETLDLYHTDNLSSESSITYREQETNQRVTRLNGRFNLRHELYTNLSSLFGVEGEQSRADSYLADRKGASLSANYSKEFFGANVSASLFGLFSDVETDAELSRQDVVNEEYVATLQRPLELRNRFVLPGSIVVAATDGFIYTQGEDYTVFRPGNGITEVRIEPQGAISQGEILLISYQFAVLPSVHYDSVGTGYSLRVVKDWFELYHSYDELDYRYISGFEDSVPLDLSRRISGILLKWVREPLTADFTVEVTDRTFDQSDSEQTLYKGAVHYSLSAATRLSLLASLTENSTESNSSLSPILPEQRRISSYDSTMAELGLNWRPGPGLNIVMRMGWWIRDEETRDILTGRSRDMDGLTGQLAVNWEIGKFGLRFLYSYFGSGTETLVQNPGSLPLEDAFDSRQNYVSLLLSREFR